MDKITQIAPLLNPKFIQPISIEYTQNNQHKIWEAVISHDSVSILLYHPDKNSFVLVKQLRPPVLNVNPQNGYMYELCAGIVDKSLTLQEIAQEEVLEECGYDVPLENIQRITSFFTSVGMSGSSQTLFYAEINESMLVNLGGGIAEEEIEVIYLPFTQVKEFMFDESYQKTPGMLMAFYWFFENVKSIN